MKKLITYITFWAAIPLSLCIRKLNNVKKYVSISLHNKEKIKLIDLFISSFSSAYHRYCQGEIHLKQQKVAKIYYPFSFSQERI